MTLDSELIDIAPDLADIASFLGIGSDEELADLLAGGADPDSLIIDGILPVPDEEWGWMVPDDGIEITDEASAAEALALIDQLAKELGVVPEGCSDASDQPD